MNFTLFGLHVESEVDLQLPSATPLPTPDVCIRFGTFSDDFHSRTLNGVLFSSSGERQCTLGCEGLGSFKISDGKQVTVNPHQPVCLDTLRQSLLGLVMAVVLLQRGYIVLHGSSVVIGEKAVLFLGNKGEGKSTLAAWLLAQGHSLLSDDVCALTADSGSHLTLAPSYPAMRLNPDALHHLGHAPTSYPRVHPLAEKRVRDVDHNFCPTPRPVAAICVLKTAETQQLRKLHGVEAVQAILPHMIMGRFPDDDSSLMTRETFLQTTQVVNSLDIYQLTRPRNLDLLPEVKPLLESTIV